MYFFPVKLSIVSLDSEKSKIISWVLNVLTRLSIDWILASCACTKKDNNATMINDTDFFINLDW